MSLAGFQQTLKTLYLGPDADMVLEVPGTLDEFLKNTELLDAEALALQAQPLERLQQYRFMVLSNAKDTLENIFSWTFMFLAADWDALVTAYVHQFPAKSYRIIDYGQHFAEFLAKTPPVLAQYPFIAELAQYEWIEAMLLSAPNTILPVGFQPVIPTDVEMLSRFSPILHEAAVFLKLQYDIPALIAQLSMADCEDLAAISRISSSIQQQEILLWVFRTPQAPYSSCRFFKLNAMLATWLVCVQESQQQQAALTYQSSLEMVVESLQAVLPQLTYAECVTPFVSVLERLHPLGIVLGSVEI